MAVPSREEKDGGGKKLKKKKSLAVMEETAPPSSSSILGNPSDPYLRWLPSGGDFPGHWLTLFSVLLALWPQKKKA